MANLTRPSTSCQMQRPSLMDDEQTMNNNKGKILLTRSYTFDGIQSIKQQQQPQQQQPPQQRVIKPARSSSAVIHQQQQQQQQQAPRLGRSLLSNDNWRQETMNDVRINAKVMEQSDQNILLGKGKNQPID